MWPGCHWLRPEIRDRKSTRLNSSHTVISYAVFCLKKKKDLLPGDPVMLDEVSFRPLGDGDHAVRPRRLPWHVRSEHESVARTHQAGFLFFFNDTATTEIYTLSLHDALPIFRGPRSSTRGPPSRSTRTSPPPPEDRKSTRLNSSHTVISYAVFCLKKKKT